MTMPDVSVQAAFGAGPYDTPTWVELGHLCERAEIDRGRMHRVGPVTGTASFRFLDIERLLDPTNAVSPYAADLLPMTPIRMRETWAGVTRRRFTGFVEKWPVRFTGPFEQYANVEAADERKLLGRVGLPSSVWALEVGLSDPYSWHRLGDPSASTVAVDAVGSNHGTYIGGVRDVDGGTWGDEDKAVTLRGLYNSGSGTYSGDQVVLPGGVDGTEDFTYAFAFRISAEEPDVAVTALVEQSPHRFTDGGWQVTFGRYQSGGVQYSTVRFFTSEGGTGAYRGVYTRDVPNASFGDGGWHLVVVRRDGLSLWLTIDGVDYPNAFSFGTVSSTVDIRPNPVLLRGTADMDEAVLWKRKLTDGEVADLYEAYRTPWVDDRAGARIGRLLDLAGSTTTRVLADGVSRLQPVTKFSGNTVLSQIDRTVDADAGRFYFRGDGAAVFTDRYADLLATPAFTLGPDSGEIHYLVEGSPVVMDDSEVVNNSRVTRPGGVTKESTDTASAARYGTITADHDVDLVSDLEAAGRAEWETSRFATPKARVEKVTVHPSNTDPATHYPAVLAAELGTRVTFKARPMGAATPFEVDQVIESIKHVIEPAADVPWRVEFGMVGAEENPYWIWGTAEWDNDTRWAW